MCEKMKIASSLGRAALRYSTNARPAKSQLQDYDRRVFRVSEEVRDAIAAGRPVVALESTIYTHGYPYEQNADLALRLEDVVR